MTRVAKLVLWSSVAAVLSSGLMSRAADQKIVLDSSKPLKIVMEGKLRITVNGVDVSHYPDVKPLFISRPKPDYPLACRRRHLTGFGIFRMKIDETGAVESVTVRSTTGHSELDAEVLKGLGRWRAKPGAVREIDFPVTFSMGAAVHPAATPYVPPQMRSNIHTPKDDLSTMQR
jgi:TonB family protein